MEEKLTHTMRCDVCGIVRTIFIEDKAISLEIPETHPSYEHILTEFGKITFDICWICRLKSLGIKPIKFKE